MPNFKSQKFIFFVTLTIFLSLLYLVSNIILPFAAAIFFAYFLHPLVEKLVNLKIPRSLASIFITILFFLAMAAFVMMIMPPLYKQFLVLIEKLNQYRQNSTPALLDMANSWLNDFSPEAVAIFQNSLSSFSKQIFSFAGTIFQSVFVSSVVAFNIVSLTIITPIVTYYILRDWKQFLARLQNMLPKQSKTEIVNLSGDINRTLSGYLRGQTMICLMLGIYYATLLSVVKLDSAIILGLASGIFTFIPYFGAVLGAVLCVLIAVIQFGTLKHATIVLFIFASGQFIEGNFIAPKILGKRTGLHPVWIMFSLLAGGSLFGFFGILIAVPLTAIIGVVIRWLFIKYKNQVA